MKRDSKQRYADWSDLANIGKQLKQQRQAQARAEKRKQQQLAKQRAERNLFTQTLARTLGGVQPIKKANKHANTRPSAQPKPQPTPTQTLKDQQAVLQESMGMGMNRQSKSNGESHGISDEWEAAVLHAGDEQLQYAQSHIPASIIQKLRRGHWRIQAQVDLHHLQTDAARDAVSRFIRNSHQHGLRCVRIIHGKGYGSEGGVPVLKQKTPRWLMQNKRVLAFVQAREADGGAGAIVALLEGGKNPNS